MVFVSANFEEMYIIAKCDFLTRFFDDPIHLIREDYSAVFRRTHQMIDHYADIVTLMDVDTHLPILYRSRAAGNEP